MRSFITGSYKYGTPKDESDIDLVVLLKKQDALDLLAASGVQLGDSFDSVSRILSIRFGKLNIIAVFSEEDLAICKLATKQLLDEKPVSRDRAVEVFKELQTRFA